MRPIFGALRRSAGTEKNVREQSGALERHRGRLDSQRERLDRQREAIKSLRGDLSRQTGLIDEQKKALAKLRGEFQPLERADRMREVDWGRAIQQLGALEVRVGRLEERLNDEKFVTDDESVTEARSLVDAVRREHDQARVRFQVISSYEERLRRLEAAVVTMYDGDLRDTL